MCLAIVAYSGVLNHCFSSLHKVIRPLDLRFPAAGGLPQAACQTYAESVSVHCRDGSLKNGEIYLSDLSMLVYVNKLVS